MILQAVIYIILFKGGSKITVKIADCYTVDSLTALLLCQLAW